MKRSVNFRFILVGFLFLVLVGCQDQVLNKQPTNTFSGEQIWNNISLVKKYVVNNYTAFRGWGIDPHTNIVMPSCVSDETYHMFNYESVWSVNAGNLSPDNMGIWAHEWSDDYKYIKNVNRFMKQIGDVNAKESVKDNLKGQMLFIRAWSYARLLNFFGGVPIITKTFQLNENYKVKRDSYKKGITWVVNQLDTAATMVPKTVPPDQWGRVTKGAVLALKSRVLLYAASKLHDPSTQPEGPLYTYDKSNKWKEAADAAKAVIDMQLYQLVKVKNWKNYQDLFLHKNPEIIFTKPFNSQFYQYNTNIGVMNVPNGYHGWSGNVVIQNEVNAFQMKDGKSIKDSPLYDSSPESIYKNRELRFYADIVYNGATFRGRKVQFFVPGGKDSPDGPEGWNYARTGYTMRKFQNESVNFQSENPPTPKIIFRLAGIYLNYAEAQYHLGHENRAREYVNKIRNRVNMPDIKTSGKELLEDIRHERRIELAFEGYNRYNDLRRWMLAEKYLSEDAMGIQWKKVNKQGELSANGKLTYNIIKNQERNFSHRMYYLPISRSEISKTSLKQNVGYSE